MLGSEIKHVLWKLIVDDFYIRVDQVEQELHRSGFNPPRYEVETAVNDFKGTLKLLRRMGALKENLNVPLRACPLPIHEARAEATSRRVRPAPSEPSMSAEPPDDGRDRMDWSYWPRSGNKRQRRRYR